MDEQKINKKVTYGIVAILLIILITIGATYAFFSAQAETGTQTVTTGTLTMDFDKTGSVVTIDGITPINDSEIKTKAAAFPFGITNTGNEHMNITIKLKDITIADDLKDIDFRWGLYNADTNVGLSFGVFKYSTTGGEEILYRDSIIDAGSPKKNYILRIWIHDDGAEQNYMQGETFSGKIEVTGTAIEYTDEDCFTFNSGSITGYDSQTCGTNVVIPRDFGAIGMFSTNVTNIIIPNGVTYLQSNEISYNNLTHLTIPESMEGAGPDSLMHNNLKSIFIPENFSPGSAMLLGNDITTIVLHRDFGRLLSESNIENIILMEGVRYINAEGFLNNTDLKNIELPSSVTTIDETVFIAGEGAFGAFVGCTNLETIVVRGKTEAPSTFGTDWNCTTFDNNGTCTKYANVEYRP